jgi:hypothetical protein
MTLENEENEKTFALRRNGNTLIVIDLNPIHPFEISFFIQEALLHWKLYTKSKSIIEDGILKQNIWIFVRRN